MVQRIEFWKLQGKNSNPRALHHRQKTPMHPLPPPPDESHPESISARKGGPEAEASRELRMLPLYEAKLPDNVKKETHRELFPRLACHSPRIP